MKDLIPLLICSAAAPGLGVSASPPAEPTQPAASQVPTLMERQKEIALALSSCPASVASQAAVYVLAESGYVKVRESQNGFTEIVQHALPNSPDPQCMDSEGTRTFPAPSEGRTARPG